MTYAYIESARDRRIKLADRVRWIGERWSEGRYLGAAKSHASRLNKEGPIPEHYHTNPYDVRRMPIEAVERLAELDAAIKSARETRERYLADSFLTWPLVQKEDCSEVVPGKPKSEVMAAIKRTAPRTAAQIKRERESLNALNRALH